MRIGYPCLNRTLECKNNRTFRLVSYSDQRFVTTVSSNLACLMQILEWNLAHDILFFRITSDLIPFASHPVCTYPWQDYFSDELASIGKAISDSGIRISMHPDQFIILNSPDTQVVKRSIDELSYHAEVLDLMGLDTTAKIQLHVGGRYTNPAESLARFVRVALELDPAIRRRLVVENDDTRFTASDCLTVHDQTGLPVLFDVFHHSCNNNGEGIRDILLRISKTWKNPDGTMMVDYSSQHPHKRVGGHAEHIDITDFSRFLEISKSCDMDIMLEIKDKEASALAAISYARTDPRFFFRQPQLRQNHLRQ